MLYEYELPIRLLRRIRRTEAGEVLQKFEITSDAYHRPILSEGQCAVILFI
ncbi:hypothetical protein J7E63_05330 [Bacillus sp. ISL-75]|nr:hypothetical protein [Bacillus sp. ISL-75]